MSPELSDKELLRRYHVDGDLSAREQLIERYLSLVRSLARRDIRARGRIFCPVARADAKLRYRSPAVPSGVELHAGGFRLDLDEPAYGVAPGQAAVLYEDDAVVGAGIIER